MTLIERVQRLRTAAVAADDEAAIKRRTGELVTLADGVETTIEGVRRLGNGVAELRSAGIGMDAALVQAATQVATAMNALSDSLPNLGVDVPLDKEKAQVKAAQSFLRSLRSFVEEAWATERSREVPAINEEVLAALAEGGIEVERILSKIEIARGKLVILNNRAVPESGDVTKLTEALEILRSCSERISELIDPALAGVIRNAQRATGVPLSSFTPEVLAGLARLGMLDRFWVQLR